MQTRFSPRRQFIATGKQGLIENNLFTFSGLNMVDPDEISDKDESPFAKNFRVFAPKDDTKRVAISKRYGYSKFSIPVGETIYTVQTSVTGAADATVGTAVWKAMPFTVTAASRLSKVGLNIKNNNSGTGPIIVKIYSNVSSAPGALMNLASM